VLPGQTKIYLYYVAQDSFPADAQRKGPAFSAPVLPAAAKLGLGDDARLVMNWPTGALVPVESEEPKPLTYALSQNYPNPFNPTTFISYQLPVAKRVRLVVYDLLGREVSVLVEGMEEAGVHTVRFDGLNLSSGVYFCRLQAGDFIQIRKLALVK
jgi:hypothetical protein